MKHDSVKRFLSKHRKPLVISCVLLILPAFYLGLLLSIQIHNARYDRTYDKLSDAAQANGLLVHHYKRTPDPIGLNRFYDETTTYKTASGLTSTHVGYKDDEGNIVLPAIYKGGDWHFHEGLNYAYEDGFLGFINPDGTWAFQLDDRSISTSSSQNFFNGRAVVTQRLPSELITPIRRYGAIDKEGNIVIELKYLYIKDFIGELDHEYTLAAEKTIFYSIYENMMNGIDITIEPIEWVFPPRRLIFLDKDGNETPISEIRRSIRKLNATSAVQ